MKAIVVKYLAATDTKGVRLKAVARDVKSVTLSRDYSLDYGDDAMRAAKALVDAYGWGEIKGSGTLPNGDFVATLQ